MKKSAWSIALRFMLNVSAWIAVPVIIALYVGNWLDKKFGTSPWLLLATIGVSFFISLYGLAINAIKEFNRISPPKSDGKGGSDDKESNPEPGARSNKSNLE